MDLLIKEANWAEGNNSLVYEFQTLGGPPGGTGVPDSKGARVAECILER